MINKTIDLCEKFAKEAGVEVNLSEPVKKLRRVSVASNSAFGIGLVTVGVLFSSKALATLGVIGLAGAAVMAASNALDKENNAK